MSDKYKTIREAVRTETRINKSRFIATAVPVQNRETVEEILAKKKKEFLDATHHCYAYRLGPAGADARFYDDGEPGGSAGKPILRAIDKFGLTDILIIVTRYFGGTKLGVGGLVRAYGGAAEQAIRAADHVTKYLTETVNASFPHSQIGNVMNVVSKQGAKILDTRYDEEVHLCLEIRNSRMVELKSLLVQHTSGNITLR